MSGYVLCWNCDKSIEPGTFGASCPACDDVREDEIKRLRSALSSAESARDAARAEVEKEKRIGLVFQQAKLAALDDLRAARAEVSRLTGEVEVANRQAEAAMLERTVK